MRFYAFLDLWMSGFYAKYLDLKIALKAVNKRVSEVTNKEPFSPHSLRSVGAQKQQTMTYLTDEFGNAEDGNQLQAETDTPKTDRTANRFKISKSLRH